jgi:MFS family permease
VFYGWWVVAGTFVSHLLSYGVLTVAFGVFFPFMAEALHLGRGLLASVAAAARLVSAALSPLIGPLVDRRGPRLVMALGVLSLAGGPAVLAAAGSYTLHTVAKPLWGLIAERVHVRYCIAACYAGGALGVLLLLGPGSMAWLVAFATVYGLTRGAQSFVTSLAWADYFGREAQGAIRGLSAPFRHLSAAAGPIVGGVLYDVTGTTSPATTGSRSRSSRRPSSRAPEWRSSRSRRADARAAGVENSSRARRRPPASPSGELSQLHDTHGA